MKQIWIFAEHQAGQWTGVTHELLIAGRNLADQLNGELDVILFGNEPAEIVESLNRFGVDRVFMVQPRGLSFYHPLVYTETIVAMVKDLGCPEMILFGATYLGRDLAPAVAARLATGCAADCCDLKLDEQGNLLQIVPGLGGTIFGTIVTPHNRPQVATIKPGMLEGELLPPAGARKPLEVVTVKAKIPKNCQALQLRAVRRKPPAEAKLEAATRVVAGGAGIGGSEGWAVIEELAQTLGAVVGATRPAVDEGWAKHDQMIGQSGKTVRPELYIGIGISGDMMHTIGIKGNGVTVAINQDPKAAIFKQVDFGIAADYRAIVPLLTEALKNKA